MDDLFVSYTAVTPPKNYYLENDLKEDDLDEIDFEKDIFPNISLPLDIVPPNGMNNSSYQEDNFEFPVILNVIELPLQTLNPSSTKTTFTSNKEFATTLNEAYKRGLRRHGLDPNWSTILTALDANECGWGKTVHGYYNYGNLTTTGNDYHKANGNRKWKDFKSLDDYVDGKIEFLSRKRYNFFKSFTPDGNVSVIMQALANRGYDPGNSRYGSRISATHKTVLKYV